MSVGTHTLEAALVVHTLTTATQQRVPLTLINVHAVLHHHEATLVTFKTFTLEVPTCVHTRALTTQVWRDTALVDVCTVPLIRVQSEAVVTATTETTDGVPTLPIGAQAVDHLTLIYIFEEGPSINEVSSVSEAGSPGTELAVLLRAFLRTLVTFRAPGHTHRAAARVHTVTTRDRGSATLILVAQITLLCTQVYTCPSGGVDSHPRGTLADEGTHGVHTLPIDTHPRKHLTLINIFTDGPSDSSITPSAELIWFTLGTGTSPGLSQCGAAVGFQSGSVDVDLTASVNHLQPTCAFTGLYTLCSRGVQRAAC